MKFKTLLTVMIAGLFIGSIGFGCQPVAAQETTTGLEGLGGITDLVDDFVTSLDKIFSIFVGSPNLNNMLRNLSAAMAVFVQHGMNEIVAAIHFALYVMLINIPIPFTPAFILGIISFIVIGIIGVLRAVVDALATFTRVY